MNYRITHRTEYTYARPVSLSHHIAHLEPRPTSCQQILSQTVTVEPMPAIERVFTDYYGNGCRVFVVQEPHRQFAVEAVSEVAVSAQLRPVPEATASWESVRDLFIGDSVGADLLDAYEYIFDSRCVATFPELGEYAAPSLTAGRPVLAAACDLSSRIHSDFAFDRRATTVSTPLRSVLTARRGVCQDFAHLMIGCLRAHGLPARYVSGYILTQPPEGQERLIGADASHAWVSIWCPDLGWVDIDPTNDQLAGTNHVTVAWGRDFADVSPLRGVILGGGSTKPKVGVTMEPVGE